MGTVALLARRHARRGRSQLLVVAALVLLAAGLLNVGIITGAGFPRAFDTSVADLDVPGVQVRVPATLAGQVRTALERDDRVAETSTQQMLTEQASFRYADADITRVVSYVDLDQAVEHNRTRVERRDDRAVTNPIYLSIIFRDGGGYRVGDAFRVTAGGTTRTFHVAGFFENIMLGQQSVGSMGFGLPGADYQRLAQAADAPARGMLINAVLRPGASDGEVAALANTAVFDELTADPALGWAYWASTLSMVEQAGSTGAGIFMASLVLFAAIVAIVVLLVVRFWVATTIRQDLVASGALSTAGVSPGQLGRSLTAPVVVTTLVASVAGVAASYLVLPWVAASVSAQSGVIWRPSFSPLAGAITLLGLAVVVGLLAALAARPLRRVEPVEALRGDDSAHSFRRTVAPLATTRAPLTLLLGIKQAVSNRAQGVMVFVVMLAVAFTGLFSATLFTSVLGSPRAFSLLMIGDLGDVGVDLADPAQRHQMMGRLGQLPGVERATVRTYCQVGVQGSRAQAQVLDEYPADSPSQVFEGREPLHANEVAVGAAMASSLGVGVGDELEVDQGEQRARFVVVGLVSTVQYVGFILHLRTDGYQRLVPDFEPNHVDLTVAEGRSVDDVLAQARNLPGVTAVQNIRQDINAETSVYLSMGTALAWGLIAVTAGLAALVVGLMTSTLLARERRSLGVRRALGFSAGQLVRQLVIGYLPAVVGGVLTGLALGALLVRPALSAGMRSAGVYRLDIAISPLVLAGLGLGLVGLATTVVVLACGPLLRRGPLQLMGT